MESRDIRHHRISSETLRHSIALGNYPLLHRTKTPASDLRNRPICIYGVLITLVLMLTLLKCGLRPHTLDDGSVRLCQAITCPPGYYPVPCTDVNIYSTTCQMCDTNSFMDKFTNSWGSGRTTCNPKRVCSEKSGLITRDHGSAATDATCQCDLSRGFFDPAGSENPTVCAGPRECPEGEELAPNGYCVSCPHGWFKTQQGIQRCQRWQSCEQRGMKTTRNGTKTQDCQCHPWDVLLHKVPFAPDRWCRVITCPKNYYSVPCTENDPATTACEPCPPGEYMSHITLSTQGEKCRPERACTKELGLITVDKGSSITDGTCKCDLDHGFYDPAEEVAPTSCVGPKTCPKGEELAPDGSCVSCPDGWFKAQHGIQRCRRWQSCEQLGMKTTRNGTSTQDGQCSSMDVDLHSVPFGPERWCRVITCPKGYYSVPCTENDSATTACEPCPPGEYTSHITVSTQGEKCRPKRACQKELGLVTAYKGSSITDATCKCDLDRGFYDTADKVSPTSCVGPKECPKGDELAPDGSCVSCLHGWFKAQHGIQRCQRWQSCEQLGMKTTRNGTSTQDGQCSSKDVDLHSVPFGPERWCRVITCPKGYYSVPCTANDPATTACEPCPPGEYMPHVTVSTQGEKCRPKRVCTSDLGLTSVDKGSSITDATCKCDLDRGFYDTPEEVNPTVCAGPKECPEGEELALDGSCVSCPREWFKAQHGIQRCQRWQSCDHFGMKTTRNGTSTQGGQCSSMDVDLHSVPFGPERWCRVITCPKGYYSVNPSSCVGLKDYSEGQEQAANGSRVSCPHGWVKAQLCIHSCQKCPGNKILGNSTSIDNNQKDMVSGLPVLNDLSFILHDFARDVQTIILPVLERDQSGTRRVQNGTCIQNCRCNGHQTDGPSGTVWWHFLYAVGPVYFSMTRTTADSTAHELYVGPIGIILLLLCCYWFTTRKTHTDKEAITNITNHVKNDIDNKLLAAHNLGCTSNQVSIKQSQFGNQNTMNVSSANGSEDNADTFSVASEDLT